MENLHSESKGLLDGLFGGGNELLFFFLLLVIIFFSSYGGFDKY